MAGHKIHVTLDSKLSWNINSPHPVITALKEMENGGMVKIHTADSLMERLEKVDQRTYGMIRDVTHWGRGAKTLDDHTDICLMADHHDSKRDYFLTLSEDKILRRKDKLAKLGINARLPDTEFLKEIREHAEREFPV
ncbi:MAG: hypothetical protein JW754_02695 [Candidatus Aenigmarchaeota archaeon]|nr:hypothetical protein [Candidatus Aenigmarchaeota archaeon]